MIINLGISSCLLGNPVRYDGGHKHDRFLTDTLGKYVRYVPVCPEVECGFGVPREAMRLVGKVHSPRLVTVHTQKDVTDQMIRWATKRLAEIEHENLCGFIFKKNSPSSGMERVKVYNERGIPEKKGIGVFARMFMEHFPLLPVEEEGRLYDPELRENFIERLFTFRRWRELVSSRKTVSGLIEFHTRHKLLVLSHSPKHYQAMGKLVADTQTIPIDEWYHTYLKLLSDALRLRATPAKQANVLQHVMGYFKQQLTSDEKQELIEIINLYRNQNTPLIVPITLINHYVRKYDQSYLKQQVWLNPHPVELCLRNHV